VNMHTPSATATLADKPNLAAALDLAAAGVPVFPAGPDKRPLLVGWQEKASTEPEQIRKWWLDHPVALPAIPVGRVGLIVIDCDRHPGGNDGIKAFNRLVSANGGKLVNTPMTKTARGGAHLFFKQAKGKALGNGRGELPDGIDVRGVGGFVIAPGAVLPDGKQWQSVNGRPLLAEAFKGGTIPELPQCWQISSARICNRTEMQPTSTRATLPRGERTAARAAKLMRQQRSTVQSPNLAEPRPASVTSYSMPWPSVLEE
jgi:Bifunctional DNA primase/polymerase, N-terminal